MYYYSINCVCHWKHNAIFYWESIWHLHINSTCIAYISIWNQKHMINYPWYIFGSNRQMHISVKIVASLYTIQSAVMQVTNNLYLLLTLRFLKVFLVTFFGCLQNTGHCWTLTVHTPLDQHTWQLVYIKHNADSVKSMPTMLGNVCDDISTNGP